MQSDSVLWEDLSDIEARIEKTLATLHSFEHAIEEGRIGQPTRQDSKLLNRLMVLAELLYTETRTWASDSEITVMPGKNGHARSKPATP